MVARSVAIIHNKLLFMNSGVKKLKRERRNCSFFNILLKEGIKKEDNRDSWLNFKISTQIWAVLVRLLQYLCQRVPCRAVPTRKPARENPSKGYSLLTFVKKHKKEALVKGCPIYFHTTEIAQSYVEILFFLLWLSYWKLISLWSPH